MASQLSELGELAPSLLLAGNCLYSEAPSVTEHVNVSSGNERQRRLGLEPLRGFQPEGFSGGREAEAEKSRWAPHLSELGIPFPDLYLFPRWRGWGSTVSRLSSCYCPCPGVGMEFCREG